MKFITKYDTKEAYKSDLDSGKLVAPNVTWAEDTDTVHFYTGKGKLLWYGTIPRTVEITDWTENPTEFQVKHYLSTMDWAGDTTTTLELTGLEGDKLMILIPVWSSMQAYIKAPFGDEAWESFRTQFLGLTKDNYKAVEINGNLYYVTAQILTASGTYYIYIS
jgi:hypothetical protein